MTADILNRTWDAIVIGTGMGGGIVGRRLAESDRSVLFVERGRTGLRGERQGLNAELRDPVAREIRGFWPGAFTTYIDGRDSTFFGPLGCGVGGTSVFYAACLERPEPHDLDDSAALPHPTGGWPVSYRTFADFYAEAEALLHVSGSPDPLSADGSAHLREPPPLSSTDAALVAGFQAMGLHPYQIHLGVQNLPGCTGCLGVKCPRTCKMDGRSAGVEPAVATGRAALLDRCEVVALRGEAGCVDHVEARRGGETIRLRARSYVLAAGALNSPRILLASRSEAWPQGCGNANGLVGRNLMFHLNEMIAIWSGQGSGNTAKAIALRDFYYRDGRRYGTLQAVGAETDYGTIVHYLNGVFDRSALRKLRALRGLLRIPAAVAARTFANAKIFIGLLEDLPYPENRVAYADSDGDRIALHYRVAPELDARRLLFRAEIRRAMRGYRTFFLNRGPELNFGHPCGTLRFGRDPANSVLDPACRVHGVSNLYVADSSFMPTSTGVNPSLTIAANALRVAAEILKSRAE